MIISPAIDLLNWADVAIQTFITPSTLFSESSMKNVFPIGPTVTVTEALCLSNFKQRTKMFDKMVYACQDDRLITFFGFVDSHRKCLGFFSFNFCLLLFMPSSKLTIDYIYSPVQIYSTGRWNTVFSVYSMI